MSCLKCFFGIPLPHCWYTTSNCSSLEFKTEVLKGEYDDYVHGGFPCGSFSRARWSENPGPQPVRSKDEIYGLSTNSVEQQAEADKGTLMATSTTEVVESHCMTCRMRGVPEAGTIENPPKKTEWLSLGPRGGEEVHEQ